MTEEEAIIEIERSLYLGRISPTSEDPFLVLEAVIQGLEVYGEKDFMSYGRGFGWGIGTGSGEGNGIGFGGGDG